MRRRFDDVVRDILDNKDFQKLKTESHHGTNRYDHSVKVARIVCALTKYTTFHYEDYVRGALLHDFFFNDEVPNPYGLKQKVVHPKIALKRSEEHFEINKRQKNMIESHMFPTPGKIPSNYGSLLLTIVDKIVSTYEQIRYKAPQSAKSSTKKVSKMTKKTANRVKNSKISKKIKETREKVQQNI